MRHLVISHEINSDQFTISKGTRELSLTREALVALRQSIDDVLEPEPMYGTEAYYNSRGMFI